MGSNTTFGVFIVCLQVLFRHKRYIFLILFFVLFPLHIIINRLFLFLDLILFFYFVRRNFNNSYRNTSNKITYSISITFPGMREIKSGELEDFKASFNLEGGSRVSSSVNANVPQCIPNAFSASRSIII